MKTFKVSSREARISQARRSVIRPHISRKTSDAYSNGMFFQYAVRFIRQGNSLNEEALILPAKDAVQAGMTSPGGGFWLLPLKAGFLFFCCTSAPQRQFTPLSIGKGYFFRGNILPEFIFPTNSPGETGLLACAWPSHNLIVS